MQSLLRAALFFTYVGVIPGQRDLVNITRARTEREGRTPVISATSQLVIVPVTVLHSNGEPLLGLNQDRFHLFEDGIEQKIQIFSQEDAPVSFGIVFDASKSMQHKLNIAREAIGRLLDDSIPGDEYQLVEFNSSTRSLCALTDNIDLVRTSFNSIKVQGWTALFDGVRLSAQHMRKAKNQRKALIILSDGQDNFSRYNESEVRSFLQEAGVVVFSIGLATGVGSTYENRLLQRLSKETGGWFYNGNLGTLGETVRSIGNAIRSQYVLSYNPRNFEANGKFRKIRVEVPPKPSEWLSVSWRGGYFAP